jgi:DNA-binding response OmpR family regulator
MPKPVLVVDDEADLLVTYERILRRLGQRVVAVGSRAAGLEVLRRESPRLVIADLRLPDGDGLEVVRAARALPTPVPVIVVTVLTSRATRQAALGAGAGAFLAKPFATETLTGLVREALAESGC